jgi:hypothetical protein
MKLAALAFAAGVATTWPRAIFGMSQGVSMKPLGLNRGRSYCGYRVQRIYAWAPCGGGFNRFKPGGMGGSGAGSYCGACSDGCGATADSDACAASGELVIAIAGRGLSGAAGCMTRVALYARYSSDHQREESIADQHRICREFAAREGWTVVAEHSDAAVSGASLLRPGFQALMREALGGRVDVVLAESLDRFSRDQEDTAGSSSG